jgi:hypothetical protein
MGVLLNRRTLKQAEGLLRLRTSMRYGKFQIR